MKVIRTRLAIAVTSSAVLASGFGLTAIAAGSTAQTASSAVASAQVNNSFCPSVTLIEYCSSK